MINKYFRENIKKRIIFCLCKIKMQREENIIRLIDFNPNIVTYLSYQDRDNENIMRRAIQKNSFLFVYSSMRLQQDYLFALECIKQEGNIIRYLSKNISQKIEILKIAIMKNVLNCRFIPTELFENDDFLYSILSVKPTVYSFFPFHVRCREEITLKSLERYIYNFHYIPLHYKYDIRFILKALDINPNIYCLLSYAMIKKIQLRRKYLDFLYLINSKKNKKRECPFQSIDISRYVLSFLV